MVARRLMQTHRRPLPWAGVAVLALVCCGCADNRTGVAEESGSGGEAGMDGEPGGPIAGAPSAANAGDAADPDNAAVLSGSPRCVREVAFTAVELVESPSFDLIIVADHSDSLSWSRDDLATGLRTLLAEARGHSARVFVLTPTQYGETTSDAIIPQGGGDLVLWRDPVTGEAFQHAMTSYTQSCTDPDGQPIECPTYDPRVFSPFFSLEGKFDFLMPDPVAEITPEMSDAELAEQQEAVADAILALGGTGSPDEQPLCTLNRYVLQPPEMLPERAVFVVIADEDDTTLPDDCLAGFEYHRYQVEREQGERCDQDCATYRYYAFRDELLQRLQFDCVPLDDMGAAHPESAVRMGSTLSAATGFDCQGTSSGSCGPVALEHAGDRCGEDHIVGACESVCRRDPSSDCQLVTTEGAPDFCAGPFSHEGADYASFFEYCDSVVADQSWYDCNRQGYNPAYVEGSRRLSHRLVDGRTAEDLVTSFVETAELRFGPGGFQVQLIGFDPAFECQPGPGQSYATGLRALTEGRGDMFPICGDYSLALAGVQDFAQGLLEADLALALEPTESIVSVRVVDRDGVERTLPPASYQHDGAAAILHVDSDALTPQDVSLSVEIDDSCARRVE